MAKKTEILIDYKQIVTEICELLKTDDSQITETVKSLIQAAQRPIIAASVLFDPALKEPKVIFVRNFGETSFQDAEGVLSSAIDYVKTLKAQEFAKKQAEEEKNSK